MTAALMLTVLPAQADTWPWRYEKLTRGVVVVPRNSGPCNNYLVSWRMFASDNDYTTFDVMRNGKIIKSDLNNATSFLDTEGSAEYVYQVVTKQHGVPVDTTEGVKPWSDVYMQLHITPPPAGSYRGLNYSYTSSDCSAGDADGDGDYEIVVRWSGMEADNSKGGMTAPTIYDCYKLDGTLLWRINLGYNIRSGAHYVPFLFYDFDGNGKAELIVKTAPGTTDGLGHYVTEAATDEKIKDDDNTVEYVNGGGTVLNGPEYLTVFDGETGKAIHTIYYNPNRGCFVGGAPEMRSDIWGDGYGNRSERYLATVAHLEGPDGKASAVMCRGYYTRSYLWAVDFDGQHLTTRWRHASLSGKTVLTTYGDGGKTVEEFPATAFYQGNHNLSAGDTDNDGKDEIIYGAAAIDDDGTLLWSTGLGHGDAMHMGDLNPDRPGLEVFSIHESPTYNWHLCDAATGELLLHGNQGESAARGMAGDIAPEYRGYEMWCGPTLFNAIKGNVGSGGMSLVFRIYWDGDVYDEVLGDIGGHNQPYLEKYGKGRLFIDGKDLYAVGGCASNNGTKGTPSLTADLFGDWREEMIYRDGGDPTILNILSTSDPTSARVPTLMHDHTYRLAIAWQNVGYNQPPHLGYYLPDSTRVRFNYQDASLKTQEITLGDSIQPVTLHYVNCSEAARKEILQNGGRPSLATYRMFTLEKDPRLCKMTLTGLPTEAGTYDYVLNATDPANGVAYTDTIHIKVNNPVSVGKIEADKTSVDKDAPFYDLSGRKLPAAPERLGIYIQGRKKIVIK